VDEESVLVEDIKESWLVAGMKEEENG